MKETILKLVNLVGLLLHAPAESYFLDSCPESFGKILNVFGGVSSIM